MRTSCRLIVLLCACALAPALADEASLGRLSATLRGLSESPQPLLPGVLPALAALEGVRLDARDGPAARAALGARADALGPALDALEALSVQGGQVRLALRAPAALAFSKATLLLGREVTGRVRAASDGTGALEDLRGIEARAAGLTFDVLRLEVTRADGRWVARVGVRIGPLRRTLEFDQGPVVGLSGAVDR